MRAAQVPGERARFWPREEAADSGWRITGQPQQSIESELSNQTCPQSMRKTIYHSSLRDVLVASLTCGGLSSLSYLWTFPEWREMEHKNCTQSITPHPVISSNKMSSVHFLTSLLSLFSMAWLITSVPWSQPSLCLVLPMLWSFPLLHLPLFSLFPSCFLAIHPCFCWHSAEIPAAWWISDFAVIQPFQLPWTLLYIFLYANKLMGWTYVDAKHRSRRL